MATGKKPGPPGRCAICDVYTKQLSNEHVPPRQCYNKGTFQTFDYERLLQNVQHSPLTDSSIRPSGQMQGGLTVPTTCEVCNTRVSAKWYAPAYAEWVLQFHGRGFTESDRAFDASFRIRP